MYNCTTPLNRDSFRLRRWRTNSIAIFKSVAIREVANPIVVQRPKCLNVRRYFGTFAPNPHSFLKAGVGKDVRRADESAKAIAISDC
jgi:hypothetical protein